MTSVVPFAAGGGLMNREDLAKSLNNASMSMPSVGGDKQFLKMDKGNGDWIFGQEETLVETDSLWAVNPMSLKHGWVAWDTDAGGPPVQEIMVPINRALPPQDSLPELPRAKNGKELTYQRQQSVDLVCISGEDEGTVCEYKQSSVGAMKLYAALTNSLLTQLEKDPEHIVAIGKLTFDKYKHKKYGTIHNPIFEIVEWRAVDDTSPAEEKAPAEEPKQATRTRAAAKPAPEPEPETAEESDEDAALAEEYAATQAAQSDEAPRRRQRR